MSATLLTVDQVRERVQLGRDAIYRAHRRGDLRAHRIGGRLRFVPGDVDTWIARCAVAPPPPSIRPTPIRERRRQGVMAHRLEVA